MNAAWLVSALLTWSAQVCVLAAAGWLAAMTLAQSKARLIFWQGLLLLLLALPAVAPWKPTPIETESAPAADALHVAVKVTPTTPLNRILWRREDWLLAIAAGAVLRLAWIGAGFLRLRNSRRRARSLPEPPFPFAPASVRWYAAEDTRGPVTYGWLRPAILLPERVLSLPSAIREAIACHELVHVRRRDWLFVIAEEFIRSLLWFHPAVWFVLSRIQLAREQVVDREVIGLISNRDGYLDALLAVAAHKLQPDLAPAPLFLRKRHLAARVTALLKEVSMSRTRLAANLAAVFSVALLAALVAVWLFPIASPAQTVSDEPGITVEPGGTVLHRAPVRHPIGPHPGGTIVLDATLDPQGEVADARVVSGPDELRKAALESVLQWHYSPGPPRVQISVRFEPQTQAVRTPGVVPVPVGGAVKGGRSGGPVPARADVWPLTVKGIEFVGMSDEALQELRNRLQIREGDSLSQSDVQRLSNIVKQYDSHMSFTLIMRPSNNGRSEATVRVMAIPQLTLPQPLLVAPPPPPPPPPPPGVAVVATNIMAANIITKVNPAYPALAKAARIQGPVRLNATIGADGAVKDLQVISGDPLLVEAATEAVRQWVYKPVLLNGAPAEVQTEITVNFTLSQ